MSANKSIEERAQDFYDLVFDKYLLHLIAVAEGEKQPNKREREDGIKGQYDAMERIGEHAYWQDKETVHYVTLAGGGPAARLRVVADEYGEVESATLQFQDWFEPWTDAPRQDYVLVERYARLVGCYGD